MRETGLLYIDIGYGGYKEWFSHIKLEYSSGQVWYQFWSSLLFSSIHNTHMILMPSLASTPEGEVLDTLSRQSRSNSKNSKAQSSTESQKMRATARSKLMEEAKRIGEALEALRLKFDNKYNWFLENVRKGNKDTFDAWQFLFADVHNCTCWLPESRSDMNLWLQSTGEALYVSSRSENNLLHTILQ